MSDYQERINEPLTPTLSRRETRRERAIERRDLSILRSREPNQSHRDAEVTERSSLYY
jgi:hypothetical protein